MPLAPEIVAEFNCWNRLIDYPRHVSGLRDQYDVFHVVDHSYSQLLHRLPPERTVVTCHDLDTFRSVLQPGENVAFRFSQYEQNWSGF